jgi:hypothetical protein
MRAMRRAPLQDVELMPQYQISASSHHRDLKQSHSMRTNSRRLQSFGDHVLIGC